MSCRACCRTLTGRFSSRRWASSPQQSTYRNRATFAQSVNWELVDSLRGFGGIRIEDDILVTESGSEVLTAGIPKSIAAIETLRAEALAQ